MLVTCLSCHLFWFLFFPACCSRQAYLSTITTTTVIRIVNNSIYSICRQISHAANYSFCYNIFDLEMAPVSKNYKYRVCRQAVLHISPHTEISIPYQSNNHPLLAPRHFYPLYIRDGKSIKNSESVMV